VVVFWLAAAACLLEPTSGLLIDPAMHPPAAVCAAVEGRWMSRAASTLVGFIGGELLKLGL